MLTAQFIQDFRRAALSSDPDLSGPALMLARIEHPKLDAGPYLDLLDALGHEAARRIDDAVVVPGDAPPRVDPDRYARVMALNGFLFEEMRFVGNESAYDDPRNSFLNDVLDSANGIPITLALVYLEVARRAGLHVEGLNFPGHFLVRCRARRGTSFSEDLIIDAFHGGALLSEDACRTLLRRHAGDDAVFGAHLQDGASKPQILTRMLLNLKRTYVNMLSYPQARAATELMLAIDASAITELRDRGLLAYHLKDFSSALRDLQRYLQLAATTELARDDRDEHAQIREHVKTLRRRVASLN